MRWQCQNCHHSCSHSTMLGWYSTRKCVIYSNVSRIHCIQQATGEKCSASKSILNYSTHFSTFPSTSRKFTHEFQKFFGSFTKWMGNTFPEYLQCYTFSCEFFFHNFCFQIILNFSTECNNILWNYQLSNSAKQCSKWAKSKKNVIKTENCFQVSFHWVLRFWNEANSKLER